MENQTLLQIILSLAAAAILGLLFRLYADLVAAPRRVRRLLKQQGIGGPPRGDFLNGNTAEIKEPFRSAAGVAGPPAHHNFGADLLSVFHKWRRQYGDVFMFSLGNRPTLVVNNYEMVKEVTTCITQDLGKPSYQAQDMEPLLGRGILTSNGHLWAYQRKLLAPEFFMDKVKGMTNLIQQSASMMVESWEILIDAQGGRADIKIDSDLKKFSADVISKACFGSNYAEGEPFFKTLKALQVITAKISVGIPGMRYVPTKQNRRLWELKREVKEMIVKLIKQKSSEANSEKNLLQMILEVAKNNNMSSEANERFIIDNCKNIFLAGYETTATAASWCLMLLASNPEWQKRAREEVLRLCNGRSPDLDSIRQMKQLTMVINETLRLYSPNVAFSREALNEVEFGNVRIPKGTTIWVLITFLHTDPAIWGPDSYEFKPERFANGATGACKLPHLFMPFGVGPPRVLRAKPIHG